jgi:hypothetical protein
MDAAQILNKQAFSVGCEITRNHPKPRESLRGGKVRASDQLVIARQENHFVATVTSPFAKNRLTREAIPFYANPRNCVTGRGVAIAMSNP